MHLTVKEQSLDPGVVIPCFGKKKEKRNEYRSLWKKQLPLSFICQRIDKIQRTFFHDSCLIKTKSEEWLDELSSIHIWWFCTLCNLLSVCTCELSTLAQIVIIRWQIESIEFKHKTLSFLDLHRLYLLSKDVTFFTFEI